MTIHIGLSPNTERDDVSLAMRELVQPSDWVRGTAEVQIRNWFATEFPDYVAFPVNSGRSGLLLFLKAMGIGSGDEVIIQAFTCVAVTNSIRWAGATPVYVDTDDTYNIDPQSLETLITSRTKAVIVQHTFGYPAQIARISSICRTRGIRLIEDCAHALGGYIRSKPLGSWGDGSVFSFGRDKAVSSVFGGVVLIRKSLKIDVQTMQKIFNSLPYPGQRWILRQLLHPIITYPAKKLYRSGLGKFLLVAAQKIGMLSFPVERCERNGTNPGYYPQRLPNALGVLAVHQLGKLSRFVTRRRQIGRQYDRYFGGKKRSKRLTGIAWLRYPLEVGKPDRLRAMAQKRGLILGNWYHRVIDPAGVSDQVSGYRPGSCPNAERQAASVVNLPTYPTMSDAEVTRVVETVRYLTRSG